jgi:hypothetical protein
VVKGHACRHPSPPAPSNSTPQGASGGGLSFRIWIGQAEKCLGHRRGRRRRRRRCHHVGPRCPATLDPIDGALNRSPLRSGSWRRCVPEWGERSPSLLTAADSGAQSPWVSAPLSEPIDFFAAPGFWPAASITRRAAQCQGGLRDPKGRRFVFRFRTRVDFVAAPRLSPTASIGCRSYSLRPGRPVARATARSARGRQFVPRPCRASIATVILQWAAVGPPDPGPGSSLAPSGTSSPTLSLCFT